MDASATHIQQPVRLFNEEVFRIPKTESGDELFQTIGFHISQARLASPLQTSVSVFPGYLLQSVRVQSALFSPSPRENTAAHVSGCFFLTLESLKGKRCCRQLKFYSGVPLLTSRWFCLSRILARRLNPAVLHPARSNCRIPLAGLRRRLASACTRGERCRPITGPCVGSLSTRQSPRCSRL
jgi:hypothetical protein